MKKILLPTDFSESARHACEYALHLYGDEAVQFILLNSYVIPVSTAEMLISINDVLSQSSEEGLIDERDFLVSRYPQYASRIEIRSENGYLENVLRDIVAEEDIYLIVMGTTGASGFKKFFIGSNAARVLRHVKCPTLTVPVTTPIQNPVNLLLALDGEEPAPEVLLPLLDISTRLKGKLEPVHVHTSQMKEGEIPEKVVKAEWSSENSPTAPVNVQASSVSEGLLSYITEHNIHMLAMIHRKRSIVKELFHNSSTREMAMLSAVPLLVLTENGQRA